jgi:fatty acid CoA ligase FadD9
MAFVGRTDVKDPGAQQDQWERLARRRERLYADEQFQSTRPDDEIAAAARAPGLRIAEVMATVLRSLAAVVDALGPGDTVRVVGGNIKNFLGI